MNDNPYRAADECGHVLRLPAASQAVAGTEGLLLEIANLLAMKLNPESLFETIAEVLGRLLKIDRASLAIYDPKRDRFEIVALALQQGSQIGKGWFIPHRGSRVGLVFDSGQASCTKLEPASSFFEDKPLVEEGMHISSIIPLIIEGKPIGCFNVNRKHEEPFDRDEMALLVRFADQIAIAVTNSRKFDEMRIQKEELGRQNEYLLELTKESSKTDLLLLCPSLRAVRDGLITTAKVDATVLITGETGTGKGVLARALHDWSGRRDRPFVVCDCAALSTSLIETELFGHEKGAFTGASSRRMGRFELAHTGTLLLDEVAEMPLEVQSKLLGALQDRQIYRVGGANPVKIDIRVIAATNRDLQAEVAAGRFRQDLYYRLNVVSLHLPPLRERVQDVLALADHLIQFYAQKFARNICALSPAARAMIQRYSWPGNIRELENVIERAVLLNIGPVLEMGSELDSNLKSSNPETESYYHGFQPGMLTLDQMEQRYIRETLEVTGWRISGRKGAAEILGLHPNTLRSKMERLGIRPHSAT
ncbi:MAG TPA: sigma 54-interacting transcriptional regulator [Candidatus Binataceae bacterium]|nr:sigma 54-interacting transcriptional regulator [Candidatus Binataceae bacterium]